MSLLYVLIFTSYILLLKNTNTEQVVSIEVLEGSLCIICFGTVSFSLRATFE